MNLDELRCQIDQIDQNLLQLFEQRMEIVKGVAAYKKENNLPIFHKDREDQIIQRISSQAAPENAEGAKVLFSTLMNISKCLQQKEVLDYTLDTLKLLEEIQAGHQQPEHPTVGCQGVVGAYSYLACQKNSQMPQLLCLTNLRMFSRQYRMKKWILEFYHWKIPMQAL